MKKHIYYESTQSRVHRLILTHENRNSVVSNEQLSHAFTPHNQTFTQHADDYSVKKVPTDLFPHLGIPTVWMMYTATWKKKTKKKKKKLKELSDLER